MPEPRPGSAAGHGLREGVEGEVALETGGGNADVVERDIEAKTERRTAQYDCRAGGAGRDIITNAEVDDGIGTG